jgi:hypothetical protein
MRSLALIAVVFVGTIPGAAQGEIFSDGFELGRTCWVWTFTVGDEDLCFDAPFESPPPVGTDTAETAIELQQADLIIGLDTTGSMGDEIANIKSSIEVILDEFLNRIPNGGLGVAGYDDYPYGNYGSAGDGDLAYYLLHRVMTATTPAGRSSLFDAVDQYETHNGVDTPESGWEMVYQVATGAGSGTGPYAVPPFDPLTAPPVPIPPDEEIGEIGGAGVRYGSMPILIWITDAPSHNSGSGYPYGPIPGVSPATASQAVVAMNSIGGRIIGVMSGEPARADLERGVVDTGALVTPDAWGTVSRPPGCDLNECCTGLDGTGVPTIAGECPLLFEITSNGSGLGTAIVDGIERLTFSSTFDVWARLVDDPSDPVDAVAAFVDRLEADDSAPLPCTQGLTAVDLDPFDGVPDTFIDVLPGSTVCFNVVLKMNDTVPPTAEPQVFATTMEIFADFVTMIDSHGVFFRVSP